MSPDLQSHHHFVQIHQWREVDLIQDLADTEQLIRRIARPVKVRCCPMDKVSLEGLGRCQPDPAMLSDVGEGPLRGADER